MIEVLFGAQGTPIPELGYTGPGRPYPVDGDRLAGYFEELSPEAFAPVSEVLNQIGLGITVTNPDVTWLKFYYDKKILFTTKQPIGKVSWDQLYRNGSLYGSGDEGPFNIDDPYDQYKEVRIRDDYFRVRVLRGSVVDPHVTSESVFDSEYDLTMMKVTNVRYTGRGAKKWALFSLSSVGGGNEVVVEHDSEDMSRVIHRNLTNGDVGVVSKTSALDYRPVLELVVEPLRPVLYLGNCNYSITQKDIDEYVDTSVVGNIRTNYAITQKDLSDHIDVASAINIRTNYSIRLFDLE